MDFHVEQLVTKKKNVTDYFKIAGICFVTVVLWMAICLFVMRLSSFLASVLLVIVGWGAFRIVQNLSIEYEYEMTNYYLDIDKIMGKARRKRIVSVDFHSIDICTYVTEHEFKNENGFEKIYDVSGDPNEDGRIFIDFTAEGGKKTRVILFPCDKLKEYIKKAAPKTSRL